MKYEITPEDQAIIDRDLKQDRVLKHLRNLSFYKFSVGDVLIREEKYYKSSSGDTEWKTKIAECNLPYKYVYVFENELGIGYIRRLSVNGRNFVDRPVCVTEFDPDQTRFLLDPEYADHMLLANKDDAFDAKSRYDEIKKKREQINRKNKKLRVHIETVADAAAWIKTLKVGDQIWWGYNVSQIYKTPYYITNVHVDSAPSNCTIGISTTPQATFGTTLFATSLARYLIFMQRPTFLDEVIN